MFQQQRLKSLIFIGFCLMSGLAQASDMAKEKRWATQVVDSLMVGEAEYLNVGKDKILALYTEQSSDQPIGGVIVLHGIGVHPNWDQIIRPLRSELPEHGWSTLSVQLPILPNEAKSEEYAPLFAEVAPRLNAAVAFLKAKGINNIAIVAHSLGSSMAAHYLSGKPDPAISAFVAIGMNGLPAADEKMDNLKSLARIKLPVLDIYGSSDLDDVLKGSDNRANAARKAGNKNFTQVKVEGADHFFNNTQEELTKRVRGWLANNAAKK